MNRVTIPIMILVGVVALFVYLLFTMNTPRADSQAESLVYLADVDLDGIPDDIERQLGYSVGEKDVTLKYFVQNPDGQHPEFHQDYKTLVDQALALMIMDYKEKNPLHINVHPVYGGEVPFNATEENGELYKFRDSNLPMNSPDNKYTVLAYFLERKGTDRDEAGAAGMGAPEFHVFVDSNADPPMLSTTEHELGHTMGLYHSSEPFSVMNDKIPHNEQTDFLDKEWLPLKDLRLYDFNCFGVPLGECKNLRYVS